MGKEKKSQQPQYFRTKIIETIFWLAALSSAFFINISAQAFKLTNPIFLMLFLEALLVILLMNLLPSLSKNRYKILFSSIVCLVIFFAIFLFLKGVAAWLIYYYLPVAITLTMAFIVIVRPDGSITIFMAICTFLIGEAFWNININNKQNVILPISFLRIYSLGLVTMFSYYLYSRGIHVQEKLELLNQKLQKINSMKSDFLANISHGLRTPITSIKNACVLLRKKKEKADSIDMSDTQILDIININIDRQARLIDNLLELAKIESENIIIPRSLIDMAAVVKEVITYSTVQAKVKNICLEVCMDSDLPKIYTSYDHMLEVFTNLLDNAIEYTPPGGSVSLQLNKYKDGLKIIVSDTGIGIKKEDIEKLFDRFKNIELLSRSKTEWTGLGLAITKKIIDLSGGKIWVESEVGKGTKFIFTLPRGLRKND